MVEPDRAISSEEPGADNDGRSGKLSYEHRVSDVLRDIAKTNLEAEILLNLRSPNGFTSGDLLISHSCFIEGAACDKNKMQGYPAARKLLMLTFGEYSWTIPENGGAAHIDRNLHLNLHAIIPKLPFLPDDLNDFFDESSLLDKIFKPRQWGSFLNVANILDFLFEPDPLEPPNADIKPFKRSGSMTLTSVKSVDPGIKVPRVLRERLYKGTSLAHTIERNFGTVGGANTKRLQRRHSSFKFSRSSNSLIPVYLSLAIALLLAVSGAIWLLKTSSLSGRSGAQKNYKTSPKDNLTHRLPKHPKAHN
jgi:hypothetical protein